VPPRSRIRVVEVRNANRARLALVALAAAFVVLAVPTARAATKDVATAEASPGPYFVGEPITFTSTTSCTVNCSLIWEYLNGTRLRVHVGNGPQVPYTFNEPGVKIVRLDLAEVCVGTSRIPCDSYAEVMVNVGVPLPTDTTAPTITATDLSAEATAPDTVVGYKVDATDPDTVLSSSCSPASGEAFPVGTTPIDCNAVDANGNIARATFAVSVTDTTPPALTVPGPITVEATSPAGAPVMYSAAASDLVDGSVMPMCTVPAGATFPMGSTTVACAATDAHQNSSNASFVVNVLAPTAPSGSAPSAPAPVVVTVVDRTPPALSVPSLLVVNATSPGGALVSYTATATDSTGIAVAPVCSTPSRTVFAAGTTTVTCTATDARGNTSPAQAFAVHVRGAGEQLVRVLQQARGWKSQALPGRVNQVIRVFAKGPARACGLLGVLDKDLRGSLGKGLTPAQRSTLHGDLGRIARVVGCARA
jgi:HYR domain-containing protein